MAEAHLMQLQPLLQKLFDLSGSPGASIGVLHQGVPIFTTHFGRSRASDPTSPDEDTLYNVASLTKLMTAGVVSNLVAQGLLEWDVPISHYLPEFRQRTDEIGRTATVTDLLANRTGLSAQNTFWGVMREEIFPGQEKIAHTASYIPAVGEFRNSFIYSTWGYAVITALIERVIGKPFSACVEEHIFKPLGMNRSTTNIPRVDKVAFKHWVGTDGVAHEFPWSSQRGWSDETGFGGAVGARSSIKELLIMYQSLLNAYDHQTKNNVDYTPGSPFRYARRILTPFIGIGGAAPEEQGYCLGTYRTQLPGVLSFASYNSMLLGKKSNRAFGTGHAARVIYHQAASFTGYSGSMILDPQSQTAIVVLANSLPLFDLGDVLGQVLLGAILDDAPPPDYIKLAKSVISVNMSLYDIYAKGLSKMKTEVPLSLPLKSYEGDYWNKDRIFCYSVFVDGVKLRLIVKGSVLTEYVLHHWGGNIFCFPADRVGEISQSMWPFMPLKSRIFTFNCSEEGVLSFTWHHDSTPGSKAENFTKETKEVARL